MPTIGLKHRILPKWFIWAGYVVGLVLLLSATIAPLLILVFPIWVLILSVILLQRAGASRRTGTSRIILMIARDAKMQPCVRQSPSTTCCTGL